MSDNKAAFEALYAACGCGKFVRCALMLAVKIIVPGVFEAIMAFAHACAERKEPVVFTSRVLLHCSGVMSRA